MTTIAAIRPAGRSVELDRADQDRGPADQHERDAHPGADRVGQPTSRRRDPPPLPLAVVGLPPEDDHADPDHDQWHEQSGVQPDAERGQQQGTAERQRPECQQHAEVALVPCPAQDDVIVVADLEGREHPEGAVHHEAGAARERQHDEQGTDHEYVDAEVLGQPARDTGQLRPWLTRTRRRAGASAVPGAAVAAVCALLVT